MDDHSEKLFIELLLSALMPVIGTLCKGGLAGKIPQAPAKQNYN